MDIEMHSNTHGEWWKSIFEDAAFVRPIRFCGGFTGIRNIIAESRAGHGSIPLSGMIVPKI
jgi:hypothetical protein